MPCLTNPPNPSTQLLASAVRDLAPPGELASTQTYPFDFHNVEMQYDSYRGLQVRLRYASRLAWQAKLCTSQSMSALAACCKLGVREVDLSSQAS